MRILSFLIAFFLFSKLSHSENRSFILVSFSNCSYCNNSLRIIPDGDHFIASSVLLGSAGDATVKQLKSLAEENFKINFSNYIIDTKLFEKITNGVFYKMPCFAILNSNNEILFRTTVDSLGFYQTLIKQYLNPKLKISKLKPIENRRLSEIGGYSSIQVLDEKIGISYFNKSDRIYFLDSKTNKLDSLYFSNDEILLGKLFKLSGENESDPKTVIDFSKRNKLPFDLHHFGSLSLKGDLLSTTDHLLYVNLKDTSEYISALWKQFVISISLSKKKINFYFIEQWHDSISKPDEFKKFDFNDQLYSQESDSSWVISVKKIIPDNPSDLNLYLARFKITSENKLLPVGIDSFPKIVFKDFVGKSLNKPNFIIPFEYRKNLLFFNESPTILVNNKWINLQKNIPALDWIYDVELDAESKLLTLVVRENSKKRSVIYFDLYSQSVVNKVLLPKFEPKSNVLFKNETLIFLNSEGSLCRYLFLPN